MNREANTARAGRLAALALSATAAFLLAASVAGGHTVVTPSSVKIVDGGPQGATGVVKSSAACRGHRVVELFRGRQSVGTDVTDNEGNWEVHAPLRAGVFQAIVKRRNHHFRSHGVLHKHDCGGDRSPPVSL
jgi:hypothetical protein